MRWLMVAILLAAPEKKPTRDQAMLQLIERQTQIANFDEDPMQSCLIREWTGENGFASACLDDGQPIKPL